MLQYNWQWFFLEVLKISVSYKIDEILELIACKSFTRSGRSGLGNVVGLLASIQVPYEFISHKSEVKLISMFACFSPATENYGGKGSERAKS